MLAQDLPQPSLLLKPFASSGDKNTIPDTNPTPELTPQKASLTEGFPPETEGDPDDGKLPPDRKDFNGLGYLTTIYDFFYQCGGTFTYDTTIANAINGYPNGARLWYKSGNKSMILRSTKDNNKDNFITTPSYIGTSWVVDTVTTDTFQVVNALPQNPTNGVFYFVKG